jgi:hypothetical protein
MYDTQAKVARRPLATLPSGRKLALIVHIPRDRSFCPKRLGNNTFKSDYRCVCSHSCGAMRARSCSIAHPSLACHGRNARGGY